MEIKKLGFGLMRLPILILAMYIIMVKVPLK